MSKLRPGVAILICFVWATAYLYDVFSKDFSAPPELTGPMLAAAAYLFGSDIKNKINEAKGNNGNDGT